MCESTITISDFNTPLSTSYRTSAGKKAFKDIENFNSTDQYNLIGIYRILQAAEYTLFSSEQGTFTKRDHMLGHKTSFNEFKRTEIIQSMFSNHNGIRNQ